MTGRNPVRSNRKQGHLTLFHPEKEEISGLQKCFGYVTLFFPEGYNQGTRFIDSSEPIRSEQILKNIDIADSLVDMNDYQNEQLETLRLVRDSLPTLKGRLSETLHLPLADYHQFRKETDRFLTDHFSGICSLSCYQNRLSACCSKDGIITFFADVVLNVLQSDGDDLDRMEVRLREENIGTKCIYLTPDGCLWRIKPVVCQMFLCDNALRQVFGENSRLEGEWDELKERKKEFTWPDRPVLFDLIEAIFLDAGYCSPLMYCHNSPGLVHLKRRAVLTRKRSQTLRRE